MRPVLPEDVETDMSCMRPQSPHQPTHAPMRQVGIPYRGLIGALPSFPPLRQPRPQSDFTCSHLAFLVSYCFLLCDICPVYAHICTRFIIVAVLRVMQGVK